MIFERLCFLKTLAKLYLALLYWIDMRHRDTAQMRSMLSTNTRLLRNHRLIGAQKALSGDSGEYVERSLPAGAVALRSSPDTLLTTCQAMVTQ